MPNCEGLPNGPCPLNKNDSSVSIGKGDLLLCPSCDGERRRLFDETNKLKASSTLTASSRAAPKSSAAELTQSRGGATGATSAGRRAQTSTNSTSSAAAADAGSDRESTTVRTSAVTGDVMVVVNELLAYVQFYRDRATADALHKLVVSFYHPAEIAEAKKLFIDKYADMLIDCSMTVARRHSTARLAHDAETEDIIKMMELLDNRAVIDKVKFSAVTLDRMPKYGPEEINLCAVVDRQQRTDSKVEELTAKLDAALNSSDSKNAGKCIEDHVEKITEKLQDQLNKLTTACTKMTESISATRSATPIAAAAAAAPTNQIDRSRNIVITGIDESRELATWKATVSRVLSAAAGRDVQLDDAFRLGKYVEGKKRPILAKLNSVWDRRLILGGARKLTDVVEFRRRVYISADEPPEIRRRNTLDRLTTRAERQGQTFSVSDDGILSIEGVPLFCLRRGFINRQLSDNIINQDG